MAVSRDWLSLQTRRAVVRIPVIMKVFLRRFYIVYCFAGPFVILASLTPQDRKCSFRRLGTRYPHHDYRLLQKNETLCIH
jgi:hypothetical protein